jgi:cellulose synthase/poly-beta-1,6-N-acetylglucosamine synthase-like glycosyltransferase
MQHTILWVFFWSGASLILYVYFVFPLFLAFLARWVPRRSPSDQRFLPQVTLLISAFNERTVIEGKVKNSLSLEYPSDRLEILVISDCSDDGTDDVVRGYSSQGVQLVRQMERLGKSAGLNLGVSKGTGEIIVFSDANAIYRPDAIRQLVKHFTDPKVGYVVGNARYVESASAAPAVASEGLYWRLETWLKRKESEFGSVVGGDGAIYAIRRELFSPLEPTDINDLLNPLQIIVLGYQGVYEPYAICYEEAGGSFEREFGRKVRIISRSLNAIRRASKVLLPWTQPRHWFCLLSHKVLRWLIPVFLIMTLLTSLLLWPFLLYRFFAILQLGFYALASAGWLLGEKRGSSRFLYLPYYFCLVNVASLFGLVKFFRGTLSPTWETVRHGGQPEQKTVASKTRKDS